MKDAMRKEQDDEYQRMIKDMETFKQEEVQKKID
jgi:hypothetical protein